MKITLDGLDGRNFTLRLPRDEGGEHVVSLHDATRLRGVYEHDAERFSLDPVEADAIVGDLLWTLSEGALHLGGPMRLGATRIDLEIRRDDEAPAVRGEVLCAALDAPSTSLQRDDLRVDGGLSLSTLLARYHDATATWQVTSDTISTRGLDVARGPLHVTAASLVVRAVDAQHGRGASEVGFDAITATDLSVATGDLAVDVASVELLGVRASRDAKGVLTARFDAVQLSGLRVRRGEINARVTELRATELAYGPTGVTLTSFVADALVVSVAKLDEGADTPTDETIERDVTAVGPRALGIDLPFLDHLVGRLEADTEVDVKVPFIERRVAKHRLRLSLEDGSFAFKDLEHGLSRLEDAVLDFEVDDEGLYFEVDAVVWKRAILRWPLDPRELLQARHGRVRLRTFAQPFIATPAKPAVAATPKSADPRFALRRVSVQNVRFDLAVQGASALPLAGGTLRLGREGVAALGALKLGGSIVYDPATPHADSTLTLDLDALDTALDEALVGAWKVDLARLRIAKLTDGRITLRGFTPAAVSAELQGLTAENLRLRPVA
jgi:hypothetical protein